MKFENRLKRLRERLAAMQPAEPPRLLVVRLVDEINVNAPIGMERGRPSEFCMVPRGYDGELPRGIPSHHEWLEARKNKISNDEVA